MEGGCQVPIAGLPHIAEKDEIVLTGLSCFTRRKEIYKEEIRGQNPEELGELCCRPIN